MVHDLRNHLLKEPVDLAEYLFTRIKQMGIQSIHGVPGDYNLVALDYIPKLGMTWVGNCNELNAGYAADGYARIKGMGALVTTFGVGELSAINAMSGAYAERVPVIHIVGTPSTLSQKNLMMLHHTLGNGNFKVFAEMSSEISCSVADIKDPFEAPFQIDQLIKDCYLHSLPVYLTLPSDMVQKKVEGAFLKTPIDLSAPPNKPAQEEEAITEVLKHLYAAKDPVILVDACAIRHRVIDAVQRLVDKTKLPVFCTPMSKGGINEQQESYGGLYAGIGSHDSVKDRIESSDLVLRIGSIASDFNTAGFTYKTSQLNIIEFHSDSLAIRYAEYPGVTMMGAIPKLCERIDPSKLSVNPAPEVVNVLEDDGSTQIAQSWFWPRLSTYLQENDVILTETGTSNFGIWDTIFPKGVDAISQVLWGSIGYTVGSCQGAALAVRDSGRQRRTVLFVGDGSFQLTVQELSTMMRHGLAPTIFVICNDGYTIERCIHGLEASYNDIHDWKYKELVNIFGGEKAGAKTYQVRTKEEVNKLLEDPVFNASKTLQFVEVYMDKFDAPRVLRIMAESAAKLNSKQE